MVIGIYAWSPIYSKAHWDLHICIFSRFLDNINAKNAIMTNRKAHEEIQKKKLEEISNLLE